MADMIKDILAGILIATVLLLVGAIWVLLIWVLLDVFAWAAGW